MLSLKVDGSKQPAKDKKLKKTRAQNRNRPHNVIHDDNIDDDEEEEKDEKEGEGEENKLA
jgi:hypothetical protein